MKHLLAAGTLLTLLALLLPACQHDIYHALYADLPSSQWDADTPVVIPLPPTPEPLDLTLTVGIRTTADFAYSSVTARLDLLELRTPPAPPSADSSRTPSSDDGRHTPVAPDTLLVSSTLIPVRLCEGNHSLGIGYPIADCYSAPQPLHLPARRRYLLRLTHAMRLNPIPHIPAVGVTLLRTD